MLAKTQSEAGSFSKVVVSNLVDIKGVVLPREVHLKQLIVTGPPGSGKTSLVESLAGWPMEGFLDLAKHNWWRDASLAYRPREVHLGIPFVGHEVSHAVFDPEWIDSPTPVDLDRIRIPPTDQGRVFRRDWRRRYVFYFQLPSATQLHAIRSGRAWLKSHPVDEVLNKELVEEQLKAYQTVAHYFHCCGLRVYIRSGFGAHPMRIIHSNARSTARTEGCSPQIQTEAGQIWALFR